MWNVLELKHKNAVFINMDQSQPPVKLVYFFLSLLRMVLKIYIDWFDVCVYVFLLIINFKKLIQSSQ